MPTHHIQSNKIITHVFLPVLLAVIVSALVNIQLFQDGGSYLFEIIQTKSAAVRHHRISALLVQLPTLLLIKLLVKFFGSIDEHLPLIRIVFSLSYSLIPIIALGLSWIVVRKRNEGLFIWTALIILFINLVNFSGVSELLMSLQLSCPLMLASVLIPGTRFFWALTAILLPIIFFLHPLVVPLFITMAIGTSYVGYKKPEIRLGAWRIVLVFLVAAILKFIVNMYGLTSYETSFLESKGMNEYLLETSLENKFFLFVSLLIGISCLLGKFKINFKGIKSISYSTQLVYFICMALAVIAGCLLVSQYSYRNFPLKTGLAMFASLSVLLMLAVDSVKKTTDIEFIQRFRLVTVLAVIFSFVIASKAFIWQSSIQKLRQSFLNTSSPCIELVSDNFEWLKTNPYKIINTWALPSLALIEQDSAPRKLLLEKGSCKIYYESGLVKLDDWTTIPKKSITPTLE